MTTKEAAEGYEREHVKGYIGKKPVVYNPKNLPEEELPFIYGWNNGGSPNWLKGCLIAENGTPLGAHMCSSEAYMLGDLGILEGYKADRHEVFKDYYPDGYRMEFVSYKDAKTHEGLVKAHMLYKAEGGKL